MRIRSEVNLRRYSTTWYKNLSYAMFLRESGKHRACVLANTRIRDKGWMFVSITTKRRVLE